MQTQKAASIPVKEAVSIPVKEAVSIRLMEAVLYNTHRIKQGLWRRRGESDGNGLKGRWPKNLNIAYSTEWHRGAIICLAKIKHSAVQGNRLGSLFG